MKADGAGDPCFQGVFHELAWGHACSGPSAEFISVPPNGEETGSCKATAYLGFGQSLYFHRLVAPGIYEAELWLTLLYVPVFPIAIWRIRPIKTTAGESFWSSLATYESQLLDTRPITLGRLPGMLGRAWTLSAVALGPLVACYLYHIWAEGGSLRDLKAFPGVGALAWAMVLSIYWLDRRDRIYRGIE